MRPRTILVVTASLWLGVHSPDGRGAARKPYGGTLKVPVTGSLGTSDPALVASPAELELAWQVHDTLVRMGADGSVLPSLVQEVPRSSDGSEWTIRLRPGAGFQDGSPVTSDDVILSWERLLQPKTGSAHWWLLAPIQGAVAYRKGTSTKISGLEKINSLAFRIRLATRVPRFAEILGSLPTAPLPVRWLTSAKSDPHPPGSGPFAWSASSGGEEVRVLDAFTGHNQGRPFLDRLLFKPYQSGRAVLVAFQLDEVHLTWESLSRGAQVQHVVDGPQSWMVYLAVNPKRVERMPCGFVRAVEQAVDRQALVTFLVGDKGAPVAELLPFAGNTTPSDGNPQQAAEYFKKVMLQEKGIPPVLTFLIRRGDGFERTVAERIQVNLVDIGMAVSVVEVEPQVLADRLRDGNYDFYLKQPLPLVRDPELQMMGIVAELIGIAGVEEYLRMLTELPTDASRSTVLRERVRQYQTRFSWIPLFRYSRSVYLHDSVRGFSQGDVGIPNLAEVWLTQ